MKSRFFILFLAFCFYSNFSFAQTRHHEAHTHGSADINIAVENGSILIELESPAANLLGFEHKPRNGAQRQTLSEALEVLNDIEQVVSFDQADCRVTNTVIRAPFDDPSKQGDASKNVSEEHSEFHAAYTMACGSPDLIRKGTIHLFDRFAGFEAITVRWVGANGQGTARLDPHSKTFMID